VNLTIHDDEYDDQIPPYNIEITYGIYHSNYKKTTNCLVTPTAANVLSFAKTFSSSDTPNFPSTQPKFTGGNSLESINGYYNNSNFDGTSSANTYANIRDNFMNDFIYSQ
jgi:hypothetical protein